MPFYRISDLTPATCGWAICGRTICGLTWDIEFPSPPMSKLNAVLVITKTSGKHINLPIISASCDINNPIAGDLLTATVLGRSLIKSGDYVALFAGTEYIARIFTGRVALVIEHSDSDLVDVEVDNFFNDLFDKYLKQVLYCRGDMKRIDCLNDFLDTIGNPNIELDIKDVFDDTVDLIISPWEKTQFENLKYISQPYDMYIEKDKLIIADEEIDVILQINERTSLINYNKEIQTKNLYYMCRVVGADDAIGEAYAKTETGNREILIEDDSLVTQAQCNEYAENVLTERNKEVTSIEFIVPGYIPSKFGYCRFNAFNIDETLPIKNYHYDIGIGGMRTSIKIGGDIKSLEEILREYMRK